MDFFYNVSFAYYPYVSLTIFFLGSIYRYETNQYSWSSSSSQLLRKDLFLWGSNLFHFGIIFLLLGHFFGLLTPKFIYKVILSSEVKQLSAMISGGIAGFFCLSGIIILIYRRLSDSRIRITSKTSDIAVLFLLFIQLLLGLFSILVTCQHLDDASSMIALASWVQGVVTFSPDLYSYIIDEHWVFKAHIFLGMTLLAVVPFTRLVHVFSFPYLYILREGYQLVRRNK